MALTPRIPNRLGQETRIVREVSEGKHPRLAVPVAPYLPIIDIKYEGSDGFPIVIRAGELVALDQWNQFVPANGGIDTTDGLTYGPLDVEWGVPSFSNAAAFGRGAAATDAQQEDLLANNVLGYAFTDYVSTAPVDSFLNYELQTVNKTVSTDMLIEYAIISAAQGAVLQGQKIMVDAANPGSWRPVVAADYVDAATSLITENNIVGKVMKVEKVTDDLLKADVIQGAPGMDLYGTSEQGGIANHLSAALLLTRPDNAGAGTLESKYRVTVLIRL